jgi:hypothetical protein
MMYRISPSLSFCVRGERKSGTLGYRPRPTVVCPEPSWPWQLAQRSRKLSRASFRISGVATQGFVFQTRLARYSQIARGTGHGFF